MKKTVLFIAAIAAMLVLGSCIIIPYNEIAVEAEILPHLSISTGSSISINFSAKNIGQYDLTGVRVLFEIDPDGGGPAISQKYWSSRFSLAQGVTKTPLSYTLFDSDVDTNGYPGCNNNRRRYG
jgi:hypothetical protein